MIHTFGFLLTLAFARCVEVYKCCPNGKGINKDFICSENAPVDWRPLFFSEDNQMLVAPNMMPPLITFVENTLPSCNRTLYLYISNNYYPLIFDKSGVLAVNGYANQDMILPPNQFCVSLTGAIICADEEVLNKKKKLEKNIHKCCVIDSVYSEKKTSCVTQNVSKSNFLSEDTAIFSGFPTCPSREELSISGKLDIDYSLNADGTLRANSSQIVSNYCVEYILERPNEKASVFTCALLTNVLDGEQQGSIQFKLYSSGFFVSVFFLTLTLISTFMLPGSYQALHWKCQTHYIVCLMIGDFLLGMTQALGDVLKQTRFCPLNATLVHFFFLAAFFWLNTMCFNIWWTFRDLRPSVDKGQETYRLALYRLYAWGIPLIIVGTGTVMDQMLTEQYPAILRPKFGESKCWFAGDAELFVYFLGPVGFLLIINLLLFVATTRELTCGLWKREGVKSSTERTALSHICLKLVIVMGITWIVDVISFAVGGPIYVWFLTDLVNALQGVFIFIVVGCQPQVWNAVKRKWFVNDSSSRNGVSSNATPSIINDQPSTKQTAVETLC